MGRFDIRLLPYLIKTPTANWSPRTTEIRTPTQQQAIMRASLSSVLCLLLSVFCTFLAALLLCAHQVRAATPIYAPPDLARLMEEGLTTNNEIASLEQELAGQKDLIPYAGSLDDPRLGFGAINVPIDTFSFDQEPMTQKVIFLAQKFPWFGKLSLREQKQATIANRQFWLLHAKRFELARQIAVAYYELGYVERGLEINEQLSQLVEQLRKVAESRYETGKGIQQDVLEAHVEFTKLIDERLSLERERRTIEDRINALLNRDQFTPVTPPGRLSYPGLKLDIKALQEESLKHNPQLGVRQAEVDKTAMEIDLAKKEYWPDMDVAASYGQRQKDFTGRNLPDFFSVSVTLNIPLWFKTRQDKKLSATQKSHLAARHSYRNLVQTLPHQVNAQVTDINKFQENYGVYSDALIPQAQQWAKSTLAAYQVGELEFDTMIRAQLQVFRLELQSDKYMYSIYQKRAELEELLGGPVQP